MQDEPGFIVIGKLVGVYGTKGWFKIMSFTRPRENIFTYSPWLIKQNGDWQGMQLAEGKPHAKGLIASIEEITDRNEAMALVGSEIAIKRN
ncbi:MAG: ribosome maturation factor RimM, partial [Proteobacteria bacterium]|nr:ribosome maturation factor RimM [Pseudomonadota bacterium]